MTVNYAAALAAGATRSHAMRAGIIDQSVILQHASRMGGMTAQLAQVNANGVCAAMTVKFVEAAMLGRLASFSQASLSQQIPTLLRAHFGANFFALMGGTPGRNFQIAARHLMPQTSAVRAPSPDTAFMVAMREVVRIGATSMANTVVLGLQGCGGHVVGFKVVPGGTCTFFDANAGIFQVPSVDDLRMIWRAAWEAAEYDFTCFEVVRFQKMPPHDS